MSRLNIDTYAMDLLVEIDSHGENLTTWEVGFVSDLIDRNVVHFTQAQAEKLEQIHADRVHR